MFKWLSVIFIGLLVVTCAVIKTQEQPYEFSWDMSAENHTGIPKHLYAEDGKHRGMSVFNWREDRQESLNQLIKNNIEWVAIIPFFYQETDQTPEMNKPEAVGKWGRRDSSYMRIISDIHDRELHVMLKPHLWMRDGWRSTIQQESDTAWDKWFESYRMNILHYALLADSMGVELLCIGAEFESSIRKQPEKWDLLISEIKEIYHGELTYAANWDSEYQAVKFWDRMDYIGLQAYFPLTPHAYPSLREVKAGWDKHEPILKNLAKKYGKPILFTEIGYRSDNTATIEPWVWGSALNDTTSFASNETQNIAYEALFQRLWDKPWFAGMYFWQWHNDSSEKAYNESREFTPRFKPAENTMAKWYGR